MNAPHVALLLFATLAATTVNAGEDWRVHPREKCPAPTLTAAVGGDDWTPELGRQLALLKRQPDMPVSATFVL